MRRLIIGIGTIVAALAMASVALALTSTALATQPDKEKPGKPTTTTTTTVPQATALEACEDSTNATLVSDGLIELTIPGSGQASFECLWTPNEAAETTTATVTVTEIGGAVKGLPTVFVRDDSPGDICLLTGTAEQPWAMQHGVDGPEYVASFDLAYGTDLPDGYDAWKGTTYWDLVYDQENLPTDPVVGAYWCAPQDPILDSLRADTNGTPLHFMASFNARSGGHIIVELTP
jgi:hypothetical protein